MSQATSSVDVSTLTSHYLYLGEDGVTVVKTKAISRGKPPAGALPADTVNKNRIVPFTQPKVKTPADTVTS